MPPTRKRIDPKAYRYDPLLYKPPRDVLAVVGRYHYVTARMVTRLLYKPTYHNYSQKILKELTVAGYLSDANWIPKGKSPGWPEYVWSITNKGKNALRVLDIPAGEALTHPPERSQLFMHHTKAVNDVLITGELLAKHNPQTVRMTGFEHEQTLQRRQLRVQLPDGKRATVTPDGWQHFTLGDTTGAILYEVDRGTEDRPAWQNKIRSLLLFLKDRQHGYESVFGPDPYQLAIVVRSIATHRTKPPEARLEDLLRWTETVLQQDRPWARLFTMTALDPLATTPTDFFTGQHWFTPFATTPVYLLPPERVTP